MTQPSHQPQPGWQPPPPAVHPPPPDSTGKRVLGMSLGVFLGVVGAVVFLCCLVPTGLLIFGGVLGGIEEATTPDPSVAIVSCNVDDAEILPTAEVEWEITNNDDSSGNWTVTITVHDGEGRQVGDTQDGAFGIAADATVVSDVTVFLDAAGGETCEIAVND